MKHFAGLALIGALLLTGCTATSEPVTTAPAVTAGASVAVVETAAGITTISEGIDYIDAMTRQTPDLQTEMTTAAEKVGNLVPALDLPAALNNDLGQRLIALRTGVTQNPDDEIHQLSELKLIAHQIREAI